MPDASDPQHSVVLERNLDAPAALVWQMWTDPDHFKAWYGPQGATIPVATIDARVGGLRHICMEMQTPNGTMQMWFVGEHVEVDRPQRLAYTESMSDEDGAVKSPEEMGMPPGQPSVTQVTVELEGDGDRTQLRLTHAGVPQDSPGASGWNMALDKLTTHLASELGG